MKIRSLKRQGAKTWAVARRGFLPAVAYEATCLGATPTMVETMRVRTSAAQGGSAVGRDRVLRLWLEEADPVVELTARPIFKWATAVWDGSVATGWDGVGLRRRSSRCRALGRSACSGSRR